MGNSKTKPEPKTPEPKTLMELLRPPNIKELREYLARPGADVNTVNEQGMTALHLLVPRMRYCRVGETGPPKPYQAVTQVCVTVVWVRQDLLNRTKQSPRYVLLSCG